MSKFEDKIPITIISVLSARPIILARKCPAIVWDRLHHDEIIDEISDQSVAINFERPNAKGKKIGEARTEFPIMIFGRGRGGSPRYLTCGRMLQRNPFQKLSLGHQPD